MPADATAMAPCSSMRFLNGGADPQSLPLPNRAPETPAEISIPAGGLSRATYRLAGMPDLSLEGAAISIPAWDTRKIVMALRHTGPASQLAGAADNQVPPQAQAQVEAAQAAAPHPDQLSISTFGTRCPEGLSRSWRDGLHFAMIGPHRVVLFDC